MLAWVMNLGFAASPASAPVAPSDVGSAPFAMGLGDGLFLNMCLLVAILGALV